MTERQAFEAALDMPAENRAAYLRGVCGADASLLQRLEDLLRRHEAAGSFLEQPLEVGPLDQTGPGGQVLTDVPGTVIGPYKLLEQIGEGGFGIVFAAEQKEPMRRRVALKVLKPGMDTRQVIARFEAERQALALMDHPNIARVLDAGQTCSGRPYFVMELVKGSPITDFCDDNHLPPRVRLELFIQVCLAVQHAHHKGIIHRDIKPSNVLVALQDGTHEAKVIDFGIAKALGQELTEKTIFTGSTQMIGSPLYMSPEQAGLSNVDVDTRSDIYSLGVLLYELLTGTTPFDKQRLSKVSYDEVRRIIREEEPARPSARISTLGQDAVKVACQRRDDRRRLSQFVRGELDWIVMKALEKDRNRRYETASALAADVQRSLNHEPVQACPPSVSYRLRKFLWRNRAAALATTTVLTALLIGGIISTVQVIRAARAENESAHQEIRAVQAEKEITVQEIRAENEVRSRRLEAFYGQFAKARASRMSRQSGQRFDTLSALQEATRLGRELGVPRERFTELRNEAIACLALTDLRIVREFDYAPMDRSRVSFSDALDRYVRLDLDTGVVSIRASADNRDIHTWKLPWDKPGLDADAHPIFSGDLQFVAIVGNNHCQVWRLDDPKPFLLIPDGADAVDLIFSPDSRRLALEHANAWIDLYELPSGRLLKRLKPVNLRGPWTPGPMAFHPHESKLATVRAGGGQVFIRDWENGTDVVIPMNVAGPPLLAWHPDGKLLAVTGTDGKDESIHVWDTVSQKFIARMQGCGKGVFFKFNHAGTVLASNSWGSVLTLWDTFTGQRLFRMPARALAGKSLQFSADDRFLACEFKGGKIVVCEVALCLERSTLGTDPTRSKNWAFSVSASTDGRLLATGMDGGLGFWDLTSRRHLGMNAPYSNTWAALESSGDLLTANAAGVFRRRFLPDPARPELYRYGPPQMLPLPASPLEIACSRDSRVIAVANFTGAIVLRKDDPDHPIPLGPHEDTRYVAVSPDGRWVATGSHGRSPEVKVWDSATGRLEISLPGPGHARAAFSPNGRWLATSGDLVRLWEVGTWKMTLQTAGNHPLTFSPDSRMFAFETGYGAIRLLDPATGEEYGRLEDTNRERAICLTFTADGTRLILGTGHDGQEIHVWDVTAIRRGLTQLGLDWETPNSVSEQRSDRRKGDKPLQLIIAPGDVKPVQSGKN